MTPNLQKLHRSTHQKLKRNVYVPSLPLDVWILIFLQNIDPSHLYTTGRQVCSHWRSEIPKVIARKYLEDPAMVQIRSDCAMSCSQGFACPLGSELSFCHYRGKEKAVFKPVRKTERSQGECSAQLSRARNSKSRNLDDFRLAVAHNHFRDTEGVDGRSVDCPPYFIRIKWGANDIELPGLEVDFDKVKISFE